MAARKASGSASTSAGKPVSETTVRTTAKRVASNQQIGIGDNSAVSIVERPRRLLLSVEDAMAVLSMTRPRFYREINRGRIETIKDGKRRMVPYAALVAYVRRLCDEQGVSLDGDMALAG